jgi:hypothetical protein
MRTLLAVALLLPATAEAANLINKDKKKYDVEIVCDGAKVKVTLLPNATQDGGIEKDCVVTLKKSKLTASGEKNVVIKNGKLSEEAVPDKPM